jgi:predicted regulator of Ras-like GTPase activity (Roadblock/LC7/MglB family)
VDTAQSEIHVPLEQLEPAMKSGRVVFSWQEVAGWIKPPLSIAPTPKVGEMAVELSLKTIIPLFMKQHRGGSQKRLAVDETIPDLFNGVNENGAAPALVAAPVPVVPPAPAPPAAPTRQPSVPLSPPARGVVPTTAAVSASPASTLRMAVSAKAAPMLAPEPKPAAAAAETAPAPENAPNEVVLEEIIGIPEQRFAAKEIVANATRLPGVDGALLALNDGLLVTSQTAPEVKAEMIAAFIPQMFGRMNQYTKELAMGPLRELTLSVEHGTWHVIKCNTIYFAVLGKRGESLPLNLLAQVATELSSQSN